MWRALLSETYCQRLSETFRNWKRLPYTCTVLALLAIHLNSSLHSKRSRTKSFSAFWPRVSHKSSYSWNQSSEFDTLVNQDGHAAPIRSPVRGQTLFSKLRGLQANVPSSPNHSLLCQFFALTPIHAWPECQKALRTGTLATQATWTVFTVILLLLFQDQKLVWESQQNNTTQRSPFITILWMQRVPDHISRMSFRIWCMAHVENLLQFLEPRR